jgi:hypothetical protein
MYPFKQGVRYWPNEELVKSIARKGNARNCVAVEVGAGAGNNIPVLVGFNYNVVAIEQDMGAAEELMRWMHFLDSYAAFDLLVGKAQDIRIPRASLVVDSMMSQHLNDMFTYHLTGCTDNLFPEHKDDLYPRSRWDLEDVLGKHSFRVTRAWKKEITDGNTFASYIALESEPC